MTNKNKLSKRVKLFNKLICELDIELENLTAVKLDKVFSKYNPNFHEGMAFEIALINKFIESRVNNINKNFMEIKESKKITTTQYNEDINKVKKILQESIMDVININLELMRDDSHVTH